MASAPANCVAEIVIRYFDNGSLGVGGNVGDKEFAKSLLRHALEAVDRQMPGKELVVPNKDVDVEQSPAFPTVPNGDYRHAHPCPR